MKSFLLFSLLLIGSMAASSNPSCEHVDAITTYTIKCNDTIFSIADHYNTTVCDLARYNHIADPQMLYAGEELYIPPAELRTFRSVALMPPNASKRHQHLRLRRPAYLHYL